MKSKYGAKRVCNEYGNFDSKHEYHRFLELRLMQESGLIKELSRQVPFNLAEGHREDVVRYRKGKPYKASVVLDKIDYIADFVYFDNDDDTVVIEDAKGMRTKEYKVKKAWMYDKYGVKIKET